MTDSPNPNDLQPENLQQSLSLPLDDKDLMRQRVLPVELARVAGVSKQSVSRWIRDGKIAPPSPVDGRLDLQRALRDVMRNTDPGRLRSRVLRQAVEDVAGLRHNLARAEDRADAAEATLQAAVSKIAYLEKWVADGDRALEIFQAMIVEQSNQLRAAPAEDWPAILEELLDAAILAADPLDDDLADFLIATDTARADNETEGGAGQNDAALDPPRGDA